MRNGKAADKPGPRRRSTRRRRVRLGRAWRWGRARVARRAREAMPAWMAKGGERRVVAVIPPLLLPSPVMWPLAARLWAAGYRPRVFRYQSYRRDIPDNAARLAQWLRELGLPEVDAVTFSLGGILLRWACNHHDVPVLGRVVMLGPPNRGAFMADWLDGRLGWVFPAVWGRCARQLRRGGRGLADRAGPLPRGTELGIVAGGVGRPRGYNPLIPGDNDMTVAVEETTLSGMRAFALVPAMHNRLAWSGRTSALAIEFLRTGRFTRHPKPAPRGRKEQDTQQDVR